MSIILQIASTFVIGAVAGVSPFILLQMLPGLMDPGQTIVEPNYHALLVTGVLVGAVTAIIFGKTFDQREPQEIFFYALGIPAILIATLSNLGTRFEAARTVSAVRAAASTAILNPASPPVSEVPLKEVVAPPAPTQGSWLPSETSAWAAQGDPGGTVPMLVQVDSYLVVIGKYPTDAEAWRALEALRQQRLRTELYVPKALKVFQAGPHLYYISYTASRSRDDALKLYRLMLINDPQLSPEILRTKKEER